MKNFLLLFFVLVAFLQVRAQSSCATNEVHARAVQKNPSILEYTEFLENYIKEYIRENPIDQGSRAVITIPTVFHVVYRTADENIPDARIQEQIARLNKDFAALNHEVNGDSLNSVPSSFRNLIANVEVQFCLAQRTPTNTATNGINRQLTTVSSWGTSTNLKNSSRGGVTIWDRSKYLNIWVCNIGNGVTGYAQLPTNTTSSTDGVVLDYRVVGINSNTAWPGYNLGRVGTHEVAHWLGLLEIWGNAACGTDNVSDTPVHNALNTGCPPVGHLSTCTGTPVEMTMNFMDMTNDVCRYMFTLGQKARIRALLDGTTGSRSTLKNSLGCLPPNATCNAPTGLAGSNTTTSSTTISWAAVSGSSGYFLEWKPNAATVWTEVPLVGSASNTYTLTGLTAATTYNFRVRTSCSSALSVYSSVINVVTLGNSVCAQPTGLTTTNITSSGATVSWNAVSGAIGYALEYSVLNTNSWTILNVTSPSAQLSGLTAATSYSIRVKTKCTSTLFSNYTTGAFGTAAGGPVCPDNYEPNNSSSAAKAIAPGTTINATIGSSLDTDYFKFSTTSSTPKNVKVTLSNIPAGKDYDLILYQIVNNKLTERRRSDLDGNVNEVVIYNTTSTGNYVVYVLPYLGSSDPANCYNLLAQLSSTAFSLSSPTTSRAIEPDQESDMLILPNPASESVRVLIPFEDGIREGVLSVSDLSGRELLRNPIIADSELHMTEFNVSHLNTGMYLVHFTNGTKRTTSKLLINR